MIIIIFLCSHADFSRANDEQDLKGTINKPKYSPRLVGKTFVL